MVEDSCSDDPNFLPKIFFAKSPREFFNHSATSQSFDQTTNQHTKLHPNWILIQFHSHIKNVSRRVLPALELLISNPVKNIKLNPQFSVNGVLCTRQSNQVLNWKRNLVHLFLESCFLIWVFLVLVDFGVCLVQMSPRFGFLLLFLFSVLLGADSKCPRTCDVALGSYFVWEGSTLSLISQMFRLPSPDIIVSYNRDKIPNKDSVNSGIRINVPFSCDCISDTFLGHTFQYQINSGDTYSEIATKFYSNLTTVDMLQKFNNFDVLNLPPNGILNVVVNCSCGNPDVSKTYGLFVTYPIRSDDSWDKLQTDTNVSLSLLQQYNQGVNFSPGNLIFIPGRGEFLSLVMRFLLGFDPNGPRSFALLNLVV